MADRDDEIEAWRGRLDMLAAGLHDVLEAHVLSGEDASWEIRRVAGNALGVPVDDVSLGEDGVSLTVPGHYFASGQP